MRELERSLDLLCREAGFPASDTGRFSWVPEPDQWMSDNLLGDDRTDFFLRILQVLIDSSCKSIGIIRDTEVQSDVDETSDFRKDIPRQLLERIHDLCDEAVVVVGRPVLNVDNSFLLAGTESRRNAAEPANRIALSGLSAPLASVRLLQAAELVVSATLSYISGEETHSPELFPSIKRLVCEEMFRKGGVGLRIHPESRFANLYHWLLGDEFYGRGMGGVGYPLPGQPYHEGPGRF